MDMVLTALLLLSLCIPSHAVPVRAHWHAQGRPGASAQLEEAGRDLSPPLPEALSVLRDPGPHVKIVPPGCDADSCYERLVAENGSLFFYPIGRGAPVAAGAPMHAHNGSAPTPALVLFGGARFRKLTLKKY